MKAGQSHGQITAQLIPQVLWLRESSDFGLPTAHAPFSEHKGAESFLPHAGSTFSSCITLSC